MICKRALLTRDCPNDHRWLADGTIPYRRPGHTPDPDTLTRAQAAILTDDPDTLTDDEYAQRTALLRGDA